MSDSDDLKISEVAECVERYQWLVQVDEDVWLLNRNEFMHLPDTVNISTYAPQVVEDGGRHMNGIAFAGHGEMRTSYLQEGNVYRLQEKVWQWLFRIATGNNSANPVTLLFKDLLDGDGLGEMPPSFTLNGDDETQITHVEGFGPVQVPMMTGAVQRLLLPARRPILCSE